VKNVKNGTVIFKKVLIFNKKVLIFNRYEKRPGIQSAKAYFKQAYFNLLFFFLNPSQKTRK